MLIPRYYFSHDYDAFYAYFLSCPHQIRHFQKGEYLWKPGDFVTQVYFILSGIVLTTLEHENGSRKICSLHSEGTVFPAPTGPNSRLNGPSFLPLCRTRRCLPSPMRISSK